MDDKDSGSHTGRYIKALIATNAVTLAALIATIVVLINRPAPRPEPERMQQMIEAQDWHIGKLSKAYREQVVELVKLRFGMDAGEDDILQTIKAIEESIREYEHRRSQWNRDLDDSREALEAEYQVLMEKTESRPSDPVPPRVPDFIPTGENDE